MRVGNHKLICILLVIMVSLAGMCFENDKTHSSFAYAPEGDSGDNIHALDMAIGVEKLCTMRMLRGQSDADLQQLLSRWGNVKRDLKFSMDCLCTNIYTLEQGKFFSSAAIITFNNLYVDELVSNFVHKADGKK